MKSFNSSKLTKTPRNPSMVFMEKEKSFEYGQSMLHHQYLNQFSNLSLHHFLMASLQSRNTVHTLLKYADLLNLWPFIKVVCYSLYLENNFSKPSTLHNSHHSLWLIPGIYHPSYHSSFRSTPIHSVSFLEDIPSHHPCFPHHTLTTVVHSWKIPSADTNHLLDLPQSTDSFLEETTPPDHPSFLSSSCTVAHSWKISSTQSIHLSFTPHSMWLILRGHHPITLSILLVFISTS